MKSIALALVVLFAASHALAEPLKIEFAGYLGNPGNVKVDPPGKYSVGAVFDPDTGLLFSSAGDGRINAYRLDGTQVASYTLPDAKPFARFDNMVCDEKGNILVLAGGSEGARSNGSVYRLRVGAPDGSQAEKVRGAENINGMSATAREGKVVLHRAGKPFLELDTDSLAVREIGPPPGGTIGDGFFFCTLDWGPDGDLYWIYRHWELHRFTDRGGQIVEVIDEKAGWPREVRFDLHRGRIIGDILWVLSGYDTISRWDARTFRPAPGVVHGGTSGSFLGRVNRNAEMSPDGITLIRDDLFAISARHNGSVYFLQWNADTMHLDEVRRIGALLSSDVLLLDSQGMVYTDNLVWHFDDDALAVPRFTFNPRKNYAGALLDDGIAIIAVSHENNLDFRNGALATSLDSANKRISGKTFLDDTELAGTLIRKTEDNKLAMIRVGTDARATAFALDTQGNIDKASTPRTVQFLAASSDSRSPQRISSVAGMPDGNALVVADGKLTIYAPDEDSNYHQSSTLNMVAGPNAALAVDGGQVCVVDPDAGTLRLADAKTGAILASLDGLDKPTRVAFRNGRLCVYESGAQRIAKFIIR